MRSIAAVAFALAFAGAGGNLPAYAQDQAPAPVEIVRVAGHLGAIMALAFSPDGKTLATGSRDYTVKLWNVATGLLLRTIGGHPYEVRRVAFSGDGTEVLSVSQLNDIIVNISDAATGELKRTVDNPKLKSERLFENSSSVAFSPDGSVLALAVYGSRGPGGMIEVIDTRSGASLHSIDAADDIRLAFSPDGRTLAATDDDCGVVLFDTASGEQVGELACGSLFGIFGSAPEFELIAFSGDGRTIAAAARAMLTQFDVASGEVLSEVDTGNSITALSVSPDGNMVATASYDRDIEIRDATGKSVRKIDGHTGTSTTKALAFSPEGAVLATGGADALVRLWDAKNWSSARPLQGVKYEIGGVAVSADGARLASDGSGSTVVWDALEGRLARRMEENEEITFGCSNCSIGFSPDGRLLAAGTRGGKALIWDVPSGRIASALKHTNADTRERSVAFLPSGSALLLGALMEGNDPDIKESYPVIWDVSAQKVLHILTSELRTDGTYQFTYPIAVSPDGRLVATASRDNVINLFDSQSGQLVKSVRATDIATNALAFSADGRILASATNTTPNDWIEMWDVATGSPIRRIETHADSLRSLAFSPDNRTLATAGDDYIITLWNSEDGSQIGALRGHEAAISSLVFAGNGTLVSGSHDGSVKIWRAGSFELVATMVWEPSGEWIVFTPEGFFEAEGRANKLAIVRGIEAYPIDAAYDLLHRPDLVREKLKGDPQGQVKAAAAQLDLWAVVAPH